MAQKGCGPYNLGALKSPAKQTPSSGYNYQRGDEDYYRPSQEERDALKDRSKLTDTEREVLNQRNLTPDRPAWDLSRENQAKYFNRVRREGSTNAEAIREDMVTQQRTQDSTKLVNNRFFDGSWSGRRKSGNTGRYQSQPYIDSETGEIRFTGKPKNSPNNKVKSAAYKMKGYGSNYKK